MKKKRKIVERVWRDRMLKKSVCGPDTKCIDLIPRMFLDASSWSGIENEWIVGSLIFVKDVNFFF